MDHFPGHIAGKSGPKYIEVGGSFLYTPKLGEYYHSYSVSIGVYKNERYFILAKSEPYSRIL